MNIIRKIFHKIPFLANTYHLLWALGGAVVYRFPSRKIFVIGITGTKGKTTTVQLLEFILKKSGRKVVSLSSDNVTNNTMPGRFFIQNFLRKAVDKGCRYALIEVTSEGVKLGRHKFIDWDMAVFLNLHPEHIESHGSFEKYREAKVSFFRYIKESQNYNLKSKKFFINKDDENANYFVEAIGGGDNITFFGKSDLPNNLIGEFNKYNIAVASVVAEELGVGKEEVKKAVAEFPGVPGRMEFIQKEPFAVVVDYAHTPESLREVYKTLREKSQKLICVLGSAGGGRDKWKRQEMGKIAGQYCDEIILTNEDSYDEDPEKIIDEIEQGALSKSYEVKPRKILDRREAIEKAISLSRPGDVVIITGKGSEKFIHVANGQKIPWSDKQVALSNIKCKMRE